MDTFARKLIRESVDKLERYANRQRSRRMAGKSFKDGTVANPAEGQHYPAVADFIRRALEALKSPKPSKASDMPHRLYGLKVQGELQDVTHPFGLNYPRIPLVFTDKTVADNYVKDHYGTAEIEHVEVVPMLLVQTAQ